MQNKQICAKSAENCKICKVVQNLQKFTKLCKMCKIVQNVQNCTKMCQCAKLCKIVQNCAKLCKMCKIVQNRSKCAKLCKMWKVVQNVLVWRIGKKIWVNLFQLESTWVTLGHFGSTWINSDSTWINLNDITSTLYKKGDKNPDTGQELLSLRKFAGQPLPGRVSWLCPSSTLASVLCWRTLWLAQTGLVMTGRGAGAHYFPQAVEQARSLRQPGQWCRLRRRDSPGPRILTVGRRQRWAGSD